MLWTGPLVTLSRQISVYPSFQSFIKLFKNISCIMLGTQAIWVASYGPFPHPPAHSCIGSFCLSVSFPSPFHFSQLFCTSMWVSLFLVLRAGLISYSNVPGPFSSSPVPATGEVGWQGRPMAAHSSISEGLQPPLLNLVHIPDELQSLLPAGNKKRHF